jgi:uncharacterized protein (DUF779 family)
MPADPVTAVTATAEALELIERLRAAHGSLMFFQSGGCCDGSAPMCLPDGELVTGPGDLLLGEIDGAPFYIDADQYARWGRPSFELDVASGAGESFSLEGTAGVHFVVRMPSTTCPTAVRNESGAGLPVRTDDKLS